MFWTREQYSATSISVELQRLSLEAALAMAARAARRAEREDRDTKVFPVNLRSQLRLELRTQFLIALEQMILNALEQLRPDENQIVAESQMFMNCHVIRCIEDGVAKTLNGNISTRAISAAQGTAGRLIGAQTSCWQPKLPVHENATIEGFRSAILSSMHLITWKFLNHLGFCHYLVHVWPHLLLGIQELSPQLRPELRAQTEREHLDVPIFMLSPPGGPGRHCQGCLENCGSCRRLQVPKKPSWGFS